MITRTADDVWGELVERSQRLQLTGTSIVGYFGKKIRVVATSSEAIEAEAYGQDGSAPVDATIAKSSLEGVWSALAGNGSVPAPQLQPNIHALLASLLEGLELSLVPPGVKIRAEHSVERSWASTDLSEADLAQARTDLLQEISQLKVYRTNSSAAVHKPLLLLYVLATYLNGTATRHVTFSSVELPVKRLIRRYTPFSSQVDVEEPFWRLKSANLWEILDPTGELDVTQTQPPLVTALRENRAQAGFPELIHCALLRDRSLVLEAMIAISDTYIPQQLAPNLEADLGVPFIDQTADEAPREFVALRTALLDAMDLLADRPSNLDDMLRQRIEKEIPKILSEVLPVGWVAKGSIGMGSRAEVPWVGIFPPGTKPSAKTGIYNVYLFAANGSNVYLSLNQGATELPDGTNAVKKRALDLRTVAGPRPDLLHEISLASGKPRGRRYEAANAYAIGYDRPAIAPLRLHQDLDQMCDLLVSVLDSGIKFDATLEPYHLLFKWNDEYEVDTIAKHKSIADAHGTVWWGKFGTNDRPIAETRLKGILEQLSSDRETHAYLYNKSSVWRATITDLTTDPAKVNGELLPDYYSKADCNMFVRIADFREVDPADFHDLVVVASNPTPDELAGALSNRQSLLYLYERWAKEQTKEDLTSGEPAEFEEELTIEWLSTRTLWPVEKLRLILSSLTDRTPQVILAGPPGTGKTWLAECIARYLTNDTHLKRLTVQFHPSYGYEDFMEGLRPTIDDGGKLSFNRVDGAVLRLADAARGSGDPHVLIIDEMNRANIPRVFGELMYLLEYRDTYEVDLLHTQGFSLPSNLHFIGTMNTADRSIRAIDIALRRRFDIFECPPDADILTRYYESPERSTTVVDLVEGFSALNEVLAQTVDRHHTIGHTFFMAESYGFQDLRRAWDHQILPLLEEYFFDQPDEVAEFKIERFWPSSAE